MKEYVIAVIVVGVIGSIVTLLSPEGEGGGLKRQVRLAVSIAIIPICILPILSTVGELRELDAGDIMDGLEEDSSQKYESIFEEEYYEAELDYLREGIADMLYTRFGIDRSECYVSLTVSSTGEGGRRLERIFVNLYGSAVWKDTEAIEELLTSTFGCVAVVAVG